MSVCLTEENRAAGSPPGKCDISPKVIEVYYKDHAVYRTEEVQTYILEFDDIGDTILIRQRSNIDNYLNLAEVLFHGKSEELKPIHCSKHCENCEFSNFIEDQ